MSTKKIELAVVIVILGWLASAGVRAVQIEVKVSEHDESIRLISSRIEKMSGNVDFIRGYLEQRKGNE